MIIHFAQQNWCNIILAESVLNDQLFSPVNIEQHLTLV